MSKCAILRACVTLVAHDKRAESSKVKGRERERVSEREREREREKCVIFAVSAGITGKQHIHVKSPPKYVVNLLDSLGRPHVSEFFKVEYDRGPVLCLQVPSLCRESKKNAVERRRI